MSEHAPVAYSGLQKALHWLIAILIAGMIPVGIYMVNRGAATNFDAMTNQLYTMHKTFGFLVLLLVITRIAVRLRRGAPAPVSTLTSFEVLASETVHKAIYVLILLVPLLGWMAVSAYPATGILFGLKLPSILPVNQALAGTLFMLHKYAAILLAGLVVMHSSAALVHYFVKKDGVMRRMLP